MQSLAAGSLGAEVDLGRGPASDDVFRDELGHGGCEASHGKYTLHPQFSKRFQVVLRDSAAHHQQQIVADSPFLKGFG